MDQAVTDFKHEPLKLASSRAKQRRGAIELLS